MKSILLVLGALTASFCLTNASYSKNSRSIPAIISPMDEKYSLGDTLSLSNYKIEIDGKQITPKKYVIYPSGVTKTGETFLLDEGGIYTIKFVYEDNGKTKVEKTTINVVEPFATVSSALSSANLVNKKYVCKLSSGDTLQFNSIYDISKFTSNDSLISITINPSEKDKADFNVLDVVFTDVMDDECCLKYRIRGYENGSYALVGSTYQPLTGYEPEWDRLHKENQWGAFTPSINFYGFAGTGHTIDLRFDTNTKEAYFTPTTKISDLDDPRQYANAFDRFTSGLVKVQITASNFQSLSANFTVNSIASSSVNFEECVHLEKPEIIVDADIVPKALVNKKFKIFESSCVDPIYGTIKTKTKVFKNYKGTNRCNVNIEEGCFIPDEEGIYTIEYSATNRFGGKTVKTLEIEALSSLSPIEIINEPLESKLIGEVVELPNFDIGGGSGKYEVETTVSCGENNIVISNNKFKAEFNKEYKITLKVTDYCGEVMTKELTYTPVMEKRAILDNEIQLPKYFVNGKTYHLEDVSLTDYSTGAPVKDKCVISLKTSAGEQKLFDNNFLVDTALTKLTFVFKYKDLINETREVKVFNIGEQGELNFKNFFSTTGGECSSTEDGIKYSAKNTTTGTIEFINTILINSFSIEFTSDVNRNIFNRVSIVLQDSLNKNQVVELGFEKNSTGVNVYLNNVYQTRLLGFGFHKDSLSNAFKIEYVDGKFNPYPDVFIKINKYLDGTEYTGFDSNKVYVSLRIDNCADTSLVINRIAGQLFNDSGFDRIRPTINILGDYGGEVPINSIAKTCIAEAFDVLDPEIDFYMFVKDPNQNIVTSLDGTLLNEVLPDKEFEFEINQYGQYIVSFTARDHNNEKDVSISYSILCEKKDKPEVEIEPFATSYNVGDVVKLPKVTGEDLNIQYILTSPSGNTTVINEKYNSFVLNEAGNWILAISIFDDTGNFRLVKFVLEVK